MAVRRLFGTLARRVSALRRHRSDRGAALLSVLLLVTVMSTIAVEITDDIRFAWRRLIATQAREQAQWYALGAENFVHEVIRRSWEVDPERSTLASPWAQGPTVFPIDGGTLEGVVRDANNCLNLNSLVRPRGPRGGFEADADRVALYRSLLTVLEFDRADPESLADALSDWIDTDSVVRGRGAEDVEYSLMAPPSRPSNTLLNDVLELRGVAGYNEAVVRQLRPFVCVHPGTGQQELNVNTMAITQAPLLSVFLEGALTVSQAAAVLEARPVDGYADEQAFITALQSVTEVDGELQQAISERVGYQTLFYDATARVFYNELYLELNSMLALNPDTGNVTVLSRRFGERDG